MRQYLRTLNPKEEVHKYTEARRPNLEAIKQKFQIEEFEEVTDVSMKHGNVSSPRAKEKLKKVKSNQPTQELREDLKNNTD